jgi:hypothetical protein
MQSYQTTQTNKCLTKQHEPALYTWRRFAFQQSAGHPHSVWATFLERDEGKQFFRVGIALISGADEMSI